MISAPLLLVQLFPVRFARIDVFRLRAYEVAGPALVEDGAVACFERQAVPRLVERIPLCARVFRFRPVEKLDRLVRRNRAWRDRARDDAAESVRARRSR